MGKGASFPRAVKLKPDEVVVMVVAWIVYRSRAHRDKVSRLAMADPRLRCVADPQDMPLDGKRMFWGGFRALVDLAQG